MILNHWITKDYFDRVVNVNFVEPDLKRFNWLLQVTDKDTLRHLMTVEMPEGWVFRAGIYTIEKIANRPGVRDHLRVVFRHDIHNDMRLMEDFFRQVIGEYLEEWQKMDDYLNGRSSR